MSEGAIAGQVKLKPAELDWIFSPEAIRKQAARIFDLTLAGRTSFFYDESRLDATVDFVLDTISKNYPGGDIPFHSRWGHFRAGGIDRVKSLDQVLVTLEPLEKLRCKLDLVITSVLLDAGAGSSWKFLESTTGQTFARSEGLGIASLELFLSGKLSADGRSLRADLSGLSTLDGKVLAKAFQVSPDNPLVGVDGRVGLLRELATAVGSKEVFRDGRPGNIVDCLIARHGRRFTAPQILRAVLDGFGAIWPGRFSSRGVNLGDVWRYSGFAGQGGASEFVPFHKLSQWMTYSLIEPMLEAGLEVDGVEKLTGLAEYRNGGLIIDSGLIGLRDPSAAGKTWPPNSDLIIEWRALTVHLLDVIGARVQQALGKKPEEFPLAKVLEGGTWWAGRRLAKEKRPDGGPPLNIVSDGTVF